MTPFFDIGDFTFKRVDKKPVPYYSVVKVSAYYYEIATIEYKEDQNVFCLNIQTDKFYFTPKEVAQLYKGLSHINQEYFSNEVE